MIPETKLARDLHEIREALRYHEEGQLAQIAETLARAARDISETVERLDRSAVWTDRKGICEHLGVTQDQFRAIAAEIPKHRWKGNVYMYNKLEVDEWMSRR